MVPCSEGAELHGGTVETAEVFLNHCLSRTQGAESEAAIQRGWMHVGGLWEEVRAPGQNPSAHTEIIQTPHREALANEN